MSVLKKKVKQLEEIKEGERSEYGYNPAQTHLQRHKHEWLDRPWPASVTDRRQPRPFVPGNNPSTRFSLSTRSFAKHWKRHWPEVFRRH